MSHNLRSWRRPITSQPPNRDAMPQPPDTSSATAAPRAAADASTLSTLSSAPEPSEAAQAQPVEARPGPSLGAIHEAITTCLTRLDTFDRRLHQLENRPSRSGSVRSGSETDSTERGSGRNSPGQPSPQHSTPHRSRPPPPHMTGTAATATATSSPEPPRAVKAFRSFSTEEKISFRAMLDRLGTSMEKIIDGIEDDAVGPAQTASDSSATTGSTPARPSVVSTTGISATRAATPSQPATPSSGADSDSGPRVRHCNPKYLPEFKGDALQLEDWISRTRDIVRSDPDRQWELAVLRAAPMRFDDAAKDWHASLKDDEVNAITTFDQLADAMRLEFPPNRAEQRRLARARAWDPETETSSQYYFSKLRALRSAFGDDQPDPVLVQDIVDGLPATFRGLLRLPPRNPVLADLRFELGDRESIWKEIYRPVHPAAESISGSTRMARSASAPVQPRAVIQSAPGQAPAFASAAAKRTASNSGGSASTFPRPGLAATYDPARVIPAQDGKPRRYRRPGDDQVIELNHPCTRCGQDHFNFEHRHLETSAHVLEPDDDDYPVASEGDDQGF
ncbi:hypothetical protein OC842_007274 [Tilletia horrida]|uniref:Retrotransposon gag domain-containing protein n=1 Tax=Tilletia horrida TaxID=155126 RepID=A0AAN6G413_9BASI|nr:hypothetical protein OC842_007274 [Tilletia horrida]